MMRARPQGVWVGALAALLAACVGPDDNPTAVKDLRVLGMSFEPPEVLITGCDARLLVSLAGDGGTPSFDGGVSMRDGGLPSLDAGSPLLITFAQAALRPLKLTSLIADPAGEGRELNYRIVACTRVGDRRCTDDGGSVELASGTTTQGELTVPLLAPRPDGGILSLPLSTVPDNDPDGGLLLLEVIQKDTFKGLGGIRVPVLLDLSTADGSEHIYAQKLMVYMCRFFPQMKENVTPLLPGLRVGGELWPEGEVRDYSGREDMELEPDDFTGLEESYIVPSLMLTPVNLVEAWEIAWYTTSGTMSSATTGGVDFAGQAGRHRNKWQPDPRITTEQEVTLTLVVRDGRGGTSWLQRKLHWTP